MADIKNYLKEKEKRERNQTNYKEKIMKHKLTAVYRVLLILLVLAAVVAVVYFQYKGHVYTGYDIVNTVPREKGSEATDIRLGNSILTYSKDGAHCTDAKGNVTWNQTYEIQDIKIATCQNVVAVGNYNGRSIYLGDTGKLIGEVATTMPIRNVAVSAEGHVAAVLADTDVTWINIYNSAGENTYSSKTHMSNSGYPAAISMSPNGELLGVSYIYVDAGVLKTNIAFYNFGPVGANQSDYMVSAYVYADLLVPVVQFMDNNTMFAVGDGRLMIYKGGQKPTMAAEYLYDKEVRSVFYNDKYVGLVFTSDNSESQYRMDVYNASAAKVGSYYFDIDYNEIFFGTDTFVAYNETDCLVMTLTGTEKYNGHFSKTVNLMLPTGSAYKYLLVTDNSIDTIQLK